MKVYNLIVSLALAALLIVMSRTATGSDVATYGALSWTGWASFLAIALVVTLGFVIGSSNGGYGFLRRRRRPHIAEQVRTLSTDELIELKLDKYRGPSYPHPVIFPDRCIGCQACVEACPHDVLAIVDGRAAAIAPDLCMEDTSCQAECPVNPKACIVINTAKAVVSRPAPTRDGSTYETNVPGCYIIGDVSGVPLIKNAVKEGSEVAAHIADELRAAPPAPADYDVAIIGIGPAGASAAVTAKDRGLRYIALEQDKTLSTIDAYPKGKYIFFKPDAKEWWGGLPQVGLGLIASKYDKSDDAEAAPSDPRLESFVKAEAERIADELLPRIPAALRAELSSPLATKVERELKRNIAGVTSEKDLQELRRQILEQIDGRVPGDQRESILSVWLSSLREKGVVVNEFESCKSIKRAEHGDFFEIETELRDDRSRRSYTARRVVVSIGLRGAPNRLRLPNEDMKILIDGREQEKVLYSLSDPSAFRGRRIAVVGGGNVAVEAAIDLVADRTGATITPRTPDRMNKVTLLVRTFFAPTVKFGNKLQLYQCAENGLIDLRFGVGIKEMREQEIVLEDVRTGNVIGTLPNDYVFALIGGERPDRFLNSIGITLT